MYFQQHRKPNLGLPFLGALAILFGLLFSASVFAEPDLTGVPPVRGDSESVQDQKRMSISRGRRTMDGLANIRVEMKGDGELVIRTNKPVFENSQIHLDSEDTTVLFESVKPSVVISNYLQHLFVNDEPAEVGKNIRVTPGINGSIVFPHGDSYTALQTYLETSRRGEASTYAPHTYYRHDALGENDDEIESFVLKRGYMATLAQNADGSGVSKVYIARDRDLKINRLPEGLRNDVSFIRVFPWRYTGKKGYGGSLTATQKLHAQWFYDWGAGSQSSPDIEYVPMRHNKNWDSFKKINGKRDVTHLLGFNEPMQKDQANMSMDECLDLWPKLMESGLRLGSPCSTDGSVDWIYRFVDRADKRGLRVDFIAVHYYKANFTNEQLIEWLHKIHKRTGRPLWVTEWNNGAPWVRGHNPTQRQNAKKIAEYCEAMDAQPWIERYAIFNLKNGRQVIKDGVLTPTGQAYRDVSTTEGFTGANTSR